MRKQAVLTAIVAPVAAPRAVAHSGYDNLKNALISSSAITAHVLTEDNMPYRTLLVLLLRLVGTVELFAFIAVIMPRDLMVEYHEALGLGEFPRIGITDFMIRQASYTYGMHGIAMWLISFDVHRYRPLLILTGISYAISGPLFAWIDTSSGMPLWWTVCDSVGCLLTGLGILILLRKSVTPRLSESHTAL